MNRHEISVVLVVTFFSLALFVRPLLLRLRTGRWGLNGLSGRVGSLGWWGGVTFILSIVLTPVALALPAAQSPLFPAAFALALFGLGFTLLAQSGMGTSWRIGVDATERTALVTSGLFAFVRNPIFTGMLAFAVGLAWSWPNVASVAAALALFVAVELQVRFVEEPYLRATHGAAWLRWAARTGRFMPFFGRVSA